MERHAIRGGRQGYDRLKLLAQDRWPQTAALLERLGIGPGMRCLDLGCGGGEVSFEIARLVGPEGHVAGIDMDEVKLALGRAAAVERGIANVELRTADVNQWSEEAGYEQVDRPAQVLEEKTAIDEVRQLVQRRGGDPAMGRKLHRYLRAAGIQDPTWRMVQDIASEGAGKELALSTLEAIADAALDEQIATVKEIKEAVVSLAAFVEDPTTMLASPRIFQAWRRRDPA